MRKGKATIKSEAKCFRAGGGLTVRESRANLQKRSEIYIFKCRPCIIVFFEAGDSSFTFRITVYTEYICSDMRDSLRGGQGASELPRIFIVFAQVTHGGWSGDFPNLLNLPVALQMTTLSKITLILYLNDLLTAI